MVRREVLDNGVRVISESVPSLQSVTVGIWVESGSRFEPPEQRGISHFLEHMLFKGTARRSAAEIAREIEALGGVLNAFTSKEYTCYYARVLGEHFSIAGEVLADIFLNSTFPEEEMERERAVVLQEIAQAEDAPDEYVLDLFGERYWPGHPLGAPVCGTRETVAALTRDQLLAFREQHYRPDRLILAASGAVDHAALLDWAQRHFSHLEGTAPQREWTPPQARPGVFAVRRELEQVHLCLGFPGVPCTAREYYAACLLNTALGGGMASRLFQEVRERRGLAYSVYSFVASYRDAGYLGVYAGTDPASVREVIGITIEQLQDVARQGLQPEELERVRRQLRGGLLLGLETSEARMNRLARNEIYFGREVPLEEVAAEIERVGNEEIAALAREVCREEAAAAALVGEVADLGAEQDLLRGVW